MTFESYEDTFEEYYLTIDYSTTKIALPKESNIIDKIYLKLDYEITQDAISSLTCFPNDKSSYKILDSDNTVIEVLLSEGITIDENYKSDVYCIFNQEIKISYHFS